LKQALTITLSFFKNNNLKNKRPRYGCFFMENYRKKLGSWGESFAQKYFTDLGYQIIAKNWRVREGEIDLIAKKGRTIIFIEVKTRTNQAFGHPAEAITDKKQQSLVAASQRFLMENEQWQNYCPKIEVLLLQYNPGSQKLTGQLIKNPVDNCLF